jgi:hypothetical protein
MGSLMNNNLKYVLIGIVIGIIIGVGLFYSLSAFRIIRPFGFEFVNRTGNFSVPPFNRGQ